MVIFFAAELRKILSAHDLNIKDTNLQSASADDRTEKYWDYFNFKYAEH